MEEQYWKNEPGFKYVDSCMTSSQWWNDVKVVLDTIGPLYLVLHNVDGDEEDGCWSEAKIVECH